MSINVSLNFMPAFYTKHTGITYGEAFYFDTEHREKVERIENEFLNDTFGAHGVGARHPKPSANIFIQPVDLIMRTQGAEWIFPVDGTVESLGARVRKGTSSVPIFVITPIWSSEPSWASGTLGLSLEDYRSAAKEIVSGAHNTALFIVDGLQLMDHDASLTTDGIHPNDRGFAQIASRLTAVLRTLLAK